MPVTGKPSTVASPRYRSITRGGLFTPPLTIMRTFSTPWGDLALRLGQLLETASEDRVMMSTLLSRGHTAQKIMALKRSGTGGGGRRKKEGKVYVSVPVLCCPVQLWFPLRGAVPISVTEWDVTGPTYKQSGLSFCTLWSEYTTLWLQQKARDGTFSVIPPLTKKWYILTYKEHTKHMLMNINPFT